MWGGEPMILRFRRFPNIFARVNVVLLSVVVTLTSASALAAVSNNDQAPLTRVLACDLPLAEANRLTGSLVSSRVRDDSTGDMTDRTTFYSKDGVTALGRPVLSVARGDYFTSRQMEHSWAARLAESFEELQARLLRQWGRSACDSVKSPAGDRVCLLHLRHDPDNSSMDVDVQISERGGRRQLECIYGDLPH